MVGIVDDNAPSPRPDVRVLINQGNQYSFAWDEIISHYLSSVLDHVPQEAIQAGYIWACAWEGDKHGLDYGRFKQVCRELSIPVRFGFTQRPAYMYDIFRVSTAYGHSDCPVRCPFYESDYRYSDGLCPTAEDLIPRLVTSGLIEVVSIPVSLTDKSSRK